MHCFSGRVLRVDLTTGEIAIDEHDELFYRRYWGGACMGLYYLLTEMAPGTDPLGAESLLCISGGVAGVPASGFNRVSIQAKSPLTEALCDSQAAGFFGPELRHAGWDGIVIRGKADHPVYLWIADERVEIRDARELWGLTTGAAQVAIRSELEEPKARMLLIGPAGENLVRFACVLNDLNHANGRNGAGAVFGSKNLKAVAVRGTGELQFADRQHIIERNTWFAKHIVDSPDAVNLKAIGTEYYTNLCNLGGVLPTHNFRTGWSQRAEEISGEAIKKTIMVKHETCWRCALGCKPVIATGEPYYVDPAYGGPEYETVASLGSNVEIFDPAAIAKGNELCNKYGMDTVSAGLTLAWAMECYEKGLISTEDTGGIALEFGSAEAMLGMLEAIAFRNGFGDLLAEGSARAAASVGKGSEKLTVVVKKQEAALHEPRVKTMLGLFYALSEVGADHLRAEHDSDFDLSAPEYFMRQAGPIGINERIELTDLGPEKVRMYYVLSQHFSFLDALGICMFVTAPVRPFKLTDVAGILSAATGWEVSLYELMKLGEKRTVMGRCFIAREGFNAVDDELPERFYEPLVGGPSDGLTLDRDNFAAMKLLFYEMAGWDPASGIPQTAKLHELELGWLVPLMGERPHAVTEVPV